MQRFRESPTLDDFPYEAKGMTYYVTLSLSSDEQEFTEDSEVADFLLECLPESAELAGYEALAAVVMPDHMHFIVCNREGETELPEFIRRFKSYTTNRLWVSATKTTSGATRSRKTWSRSRETGGG